MPALAVVEPAPVARPAPTRRGAQGRPRGGASTRLRSVGLAEVGADPVTVTITIAAGGRARRDRVLAALRDLVEAVGPDGAVVGTPTAALTSPVTSEAVGADRSSVVVDPLPRTVVRGGRPLELSRLEFDLLLFLAEHPKQVFGRSQLLAQVWGHTHTGARTIDVHVSRLRTKLGPRSDVITTVYGVGYRLGDDVPVSIVRR
jgi:hypothetical protein